MDAKRVDLLTTLVTTVPVKIVSERYREDTKLQRRITTYDIIVSALFVSSSISIQHKCRIISTVHSLWLFFFLITDIHITNIPFLLHPAETEKRLTQSCSLSHNHSLFFQGHLFSFIFALFRLFWSSLQLRFFILLLSKSYFALVLVVLVLLSKELF